MSKQTLNTIKSWFNTGFKPLQQQFWDTFDSFWHKDEIIPAANIENLEIRFGEKADNDSLTRHIHDLSAHGLDRKAGLGNQNNFLVENTFLQKIRAPEINTDSGLDFNLDKKGQVGVKGFSGKLSFDTTDGTLSFSNTPSAQQASTDPSFSGSTVKITQTGDLYTPGTLNAAGLSLNANFHQHIKPAIASSSEDTILFLPKEDGTLSRKEDIPVVSAGNNITITGNGLNLVINAAGGGGEDTSLITTVTYEELKGLIQTKSLIPGKEYQISDFQSTFVYGEHSVNGLSEGLVYGSVVYSGPIEPLIVMAITPVKFYSVARSAEYPEDEIIYTTENLFGGILSSTKGTILRRTDTGLKNTANFDYRRTKFRTNKGEPKNALNLVSNCTINASGFYGSIMPVIIGRMKNSELFSINGDIMSSLIDSYLNMDMCRIHSSRMDVYKCYVKGAVFSSYINFVGGATLNSICARIGHVNTPIQNVMLIINRYGTSCIVGTKDYYGLYMQENDAAGVRISNRLN
ncbi:hypothetical protein HDF26_005211 [Pedobacter cryoconitis]|uniref:hypothetical protein n=1 Tax=Pedobacter cryoconitis TaxID=188932 RepID=UPI00161B0493|nr:hypothetical protein [Pedobacter cryoconitis]MBB6274729.1 hypothetical protein [Pedobacter cryoconitis]